LKELGALYERAKNSPFKKGERLHHVKKDWCQNKSSQLVRKRNAIADLTGIQPLFLDLEGMHPLKASKNREQE